MLKQTITYKDFDDNEVTEDLYFNFTKTDLMDNLELKDDLERVQKQLGTVPRELTTEENKMVLDMVKQLMRLSYGIRSADGRKFSKKGAWEEFEDTAVYDAFLWSLFEEEGKAINFMFGILPSDLRDQIKSENDQLQLELPASEPVLDKEDAVDVDALLAEMPDEEAPAEPEKQPISARQVEFLKRRLTEQQLEELLKTRTVVDE